MLSSGSSVMTEMRLPITIIIIIITSAKADHTH